MKKLVLTGAAGRLGSYLREPLSKIADNLVSSDLVDDIGTLYPGETYQRADLAVYADIHELLEGADMVVHFGAIGDEAPFETLLGPNFVGAYNIWEAAYQRGLKRVVYASSIHAVGMHPKNQFIGTDAPHRPDTFYGLAKCFAEDLGSMYWDKRGVSLFACVFFLVHRLPMLEHWVAGFPMTTLSIWSKHLLIHRLPVFPLFMAYLIITERQLIMPKRVF